jgi:plasmid stability protein
MKNVTITLEEEVARWARIRAAENNTSVSRLVGEMLRDKMDEEKNYQMAMNRYLSQPPTMLKDPVAKYPTREELYGR